MPGEKNEKADRSSVVSVRRANRVFFGSRFRSDPIRRDDIRLSWDSSRLTSREVFSLCSEKYFTGREKKKSREPVTVWGPAANTIYYYHPCASVRRTRRYIQKSNIWASSNNNNIMVREICSDSLSIVARSFRDLFSPSPETGPNSMAKINRPLGQRAHDFERAEICIFGCLVVRLETSTSTTIRREVYYWIIRTLLFFFFLTGRFCPF